MFRPSSLRARPQHLTSLVGAVAVVGLLSACGADPGATVSTLRPLSSTNYATTPPSSVVPFDPGTTLPPPIVHTVKAGESVFGIASKYGVRPDELASYNNWAQGVNKPLVVDETILIPPSATQVTTTLPGLPLPTETTFPPPEPARGEYVIKQGDGIRMIADKCGVEVSALLRINAWPDTNVGILVDQVIKIPPSTKSYDKSACDGI